VSNPQAAIFLLWAGVSLSVACGWALLAWYRFRLNRYEQELRDAYALRFEHGAAIALEIHASLAQALSRSKAVLERVRDDHPEAASTRAALKEVSDLLEGAAIESDRAVRSLEMIPSDAIAGSGSNSLQYLHGSTHTPDDS
jgi:hypothetical protein